MTTQRLLATAALAILIACVLGVVSLVAQQGQGPVMSGRVVAADGTPAAGVRVAAQLADQSSLEPATSSV